MDNLDGKLKMENNKYHTYEDGLREGRFKALEDGLKGHGDRLNEHGKRISAQERINYAILGALALLEILPTIRAIVAGG